MFDFFELDYFYNDLGTQIFLLAQVFYKNIPDKFLANKVQYWFATYSDGKYILYEKGTLYDNDDFEEFILCYGEELGVPIRKELIAYAVKTD